MFGRQKAAILVAEFLGTGVLTLLILSVQRSTIGVPFFVALAAGLTLTLMLIVLGSGGKERSNLNPAVTIGLWTARQIPTLTAVAYIVVQLLGAWGAYYLYTYFVRNSLQPIGGHFNSHVLVAEAVGAFIFTFSWAAALYQKLSGAATAAVAGIAYMIGIIAASSAAIGLLNPAVALGARAWVPVGGDVAGWATYALGPVLGAIIGFNLYGLLFAGSKRATAKASVAPAKNASKRAKK